MIYFIRAKGTDYVKIGFTSGSARDRLHLLQTGSPHDLALEATMPGDKSTEAALHAEFSEHRERGEWFCLSSDTVEQRAVASPPKPGRRPEPAMTLREYRIDVAMVTLRMYHRRITGIDIKVDDFAHDLAEDLVKVIESSEEGWGRHKKACQKAEDRWTQRTVAHESWLSGCEQL